MGNGLAISSGDYGQDAYDAHGSFTNNIIVVNNGYGVIDWTANYLTIKNNIFMEHSMVIKFFDLKKNYLDADSTGVPINGHDISNNIYYNTSGQLRFDWGQTHILVLLHGAQQQDKT